MRRLYTFMGGAALAVASFLMDTSANAQLYTFSTHTFTPAGATGRFGPTLLDCQTAYSGEAWASDLSYFNMSTQGIQLWTVPATGNYEIEVVGAQGGTGGCNTGGLGASMTGTFALTEGQILMIAVGQEGVENTGCSSNDSGPGGGGSFVVDSSSLTPLIIAGGGGGGGAGAPGQDATDAEGGLNGGGGTAGNGGINGGGGGGATGGTAGDGVTPGGVGGSCSYGGGGGGFYSRGGSNCSGSAPLIYGWGFLDGDAVGGEAGAIHGGTEGGFGGGSGVGHRASGGGGYSGGGGDASNLGGGGGGSYNTGTDQTNVAGANTGDGYVIITQLCFPVTSSISADTICYGDSLTLSATSTIGGTITWDNGAPNGTAFVPDTTGLVTYTTSSDTIDCAVQAMIMIQESPDFSVAGTDELAGGDGTALITLTGGIFPFTFDWDIDGTGDFDDDQNQTGLSAGTYTVTVMHGNGCTATQSVTINSQLGVEELSTALGRIYPNPATDNITISYPGDYTYSIVNAAGQTVLTANGSEETVLNVNTYKAGTYLVHIVGDNYSEIVKITKM